MVHKKKKIKLMLKRYKFVELRQTHSYRVGYEYNDNEVRRVAILDHIMRVLVLSCGKGLNTRHIYLTLDYDDGGLFAFMNEIWNPITNKKLRYDAKMNLEQKIRESIKVKIIEV